MNSDGNNFGRTLRNVLLPLVGLIFVVFIAWMMLGGSNAKSDRLYSQYIDLFRDNKVESFTLDLNSDKVTMTLRKEYWGEFKGASESNGRIIYTVPDANLFNNDVRAIIDNYNTDDDPSNDVTYDYLPVKEVSWLISLLPSLLIIGLMIAMWVMMRRSMNSLDGGKMMGFGKARVKMTSDEKRKTTFADVAGADEEKEELQEIVTFLKSPKKFTELGARVPKGVLLVGPPGTGKTLLARAVAGEADVPFFSISGSDFVEMYVGVGASRVRDLFDQAKKNSPCIIFIDEIDAVGRQRGAGLGGGHDEREQTLNQLLVEMDGFGANEGVIMIAATNRPDILDPALMRPGRFDRQIVVNYPDLKGREAILKVHARGKPLAPDVELATIAKSTAGFTGADLENLLNEAALLAARRGLHSITMKEIEEATIKVVVGTEKRSHRMTDKEKRLTAYHEAGHAIVAYYCPSQDPVHEISIIPRGMAGGYTMQLPQEDRSYKLRGEMQEEIEVLLGGRMAESLVLEDISTGASNDLERATDMARSMVTKYGMSERLGPIVFGSSNDEVFLGRDLGHTRNYSEEIAGRIDEEINSIIENGYQASRRKLSEHLNQLHEVAKYLIENEKLSGEEFARLMERTSAPLPPTAE